jgi:23S rRNA (adenine-N6)-dimethyltransferase
VAGRAREPRGAAGQHFLRSSALAAELVLESGVASDDVVLDAGAGAGILTAELALWAARVLAIELDPSLASGLRRRFAGVANVTVVEGDVLREALPAAPFRVVSNLPFAAAAGLLSRLLDDPALPLSRADVIIEAGAARKRACARPSTLRSVLWSPWYELSVARLLPPEAFRPRPSVAAALLVARRRARPLLPPGERERFARLVRAAFAEPRGTVRAGLAQVLSPGQFKRAARELGFARDARPRDLVAAQWVSLYALVAELTGGATAARVRAARPGRDARARTMRPAASSRPGAPPARGEGGAAPRG